MDKDDKPKEVFVSPMTVETMYVFLRGKYPQAKNIEIVRHMAAQFPEGAISG